MRKRAEVKRVGQFTLALAIHNSRASGEKWAVIEHHVNEFLRKEGESTLSLARIKSIPKDHAAEIDRYLSIRAMHEALAKYGAKSAR